MKQVVPFFKAVLAKWSKDNVSQLAAAVAFFAVLSLAPLLIITVAILGLFFGEGEARQEIVSQAESLVGEEGAVIFDEILENAARPGAGIAGLVIGFGALLFAASNVFVQLQFAMNRIWDVVVDPTAGIWNQVKARAFTFLLVLGVGAVLIVSLVLRAYLSGAADTIEQALPGPAFLWTVVDFIVSALVFTLLFAVLFKVIPNAKIHWHDVWIGAAVTGVVFTIGRVLMGWYLGDSAAASAYGAAGSLIVLLLWIFYSTQIVFFGAEFTQVYSRVRGESIPPDETAVAEPLEREYHRERVRDSISRITGETREQVKAREPQYHDHVDRDAFLEEAHSGEAADENPETAEKAEGKPGGRSDGKPRDRRVRTTDRRRDDPDARRQERKEMRDRLP